MSHNLTETATYDANVTVPDDGDTRNAASVNTAFQALANRTKYINTLTGTSGVKITRSAASTAALKALTGMANGEICRVDNELFVFDLGGGLSPPGDRDTLALEADDETGVWFNVLAGNAYLVGGPLGEDARWNVPPFNGTVEFSQKYETSPDFRDVVNQTTYTDTGFESETVSVQNGDRVIVHTNFVFISGDENNHGLRIASYNGTTTAAVPGSEFEAFANPAAVGGTAWPIQLYAYHEITANGTMKYKVQATSGASNTVRLYKPRQILLQVIRPLLAAVCVLTVLLAHCVNAIGRLSLF